MAELVDLVGAKCHVLATADASRVLIIEAAHVQYQSLDQRCRARFQRVMTLWCEQHRLTQEMFNGNEGRYHRGDASILLQAFKAFKVRLYGFVCDIDGLRTHVIVQVDPSKKQNKADPKLLDVAKTSALDILESLRKRDNDQRKRKPEGRD